jgi:hypothetical protein
MRWDEEASYAGSAAGMEGPQPDRARRRLLLRGMVLGSLALVVVIGVVLALLRAPAKPVLLTSTPTATPSTPDGVWHDVGLSADEQIIFSRSAPQSAYSCGIANKTIVMHVTHDGGMSWRPVAMATPIASEFCALAVDETNPQQLALMTLVTKPDPCVTTLCTPTPCASACQPCVDYCPPPPQRTLTLFRSADGGVTWKSSAPLPNRVHFTLDIAFAGATLYAWTDTWPTLLAASVEGGPFQLINLSTYFPAPQNSNAYQTYQASTHLLPLRGQLYVPIPGGDYTNQYIVTSDGGVSWTHHAFTMDGDPVVLRPNSGLDGQTLMGERIHTTGYLVLSMDGGNTWLPAPAPSPDFSHLGQMQCYVTADGGFLWFNGFDASFGLGVYQARAGATAWTKLLGSTQIQDISVDLVSYDANGHLVALWGRASRTKWVVYRIH